MTVTCKINNFKFDCENIARYIDLENDGIVSVIKDGGNVEGANTASHLVHRTLLQQKKHCKSKKKKKVFFNQVSMYVNVKSKKKDNVHIKLFSNGSIQITGCQSAENIVEVLSCVMQKLKITKAIIDKKTNTIIEKPFVSNLELADISNLQNLKICMINTNFKVQFHMNLKKLYTLISDAGIDCRLDRISHSCVNIKYEHPEKKISIFVFEKGSIVITGAKNGDQIIFAYNFINKFLYSNYKQIVKKDIQSDNLDKFIDSDKKIEK